MRIAAAGGGTGGHLYPALAVLESLAAIRKIDVTYFCIKRGLESKVIPQEHPEYKIITIDLKGLKRPIFHPANFTRLLKIFQNESIIASGIEGCDFGFVTGGYVSYPVARVCSKKRIPFFVQEQNVIPGLANKALSLKAKKVFVAFEESANYFPKSVHKKIVVTGNPIRIKECTQNSFGEDYILVLGGSRGSEFINRLMEQVYQTEKQMRFVHSTGDSNWTNRLSAYQNVQAFDYIYDMACAWKGAKAVVSRAGAIAVSEMLYYGVPGLLIPWEGSAGNHQLFNAMYVEKIGRGIMAREKDLTSQVLVEKLSHVISLGKEMQKRENPAGLIAKIILEELK
ncbi:MAG TPA: UDP-N-acetylglucosamine--N-acetylmuramyl-(pentapeptide) pyrophosphoryl-undecaprenol N-acetylglucosamine transferase [Pseudothermotoga sp.]|uniref:UDP-N-acetylglucosamine--N-acetylmuramyl- (pentapeptide) pyrophosphoryl-undecaprenol N-acetylglucosamine transferase n=1 Tax=Thermotoga profunda TaxID=1508420 RepID=UPI0005971350|nr:UDP-N-acetylglucosamine--N-acetylmuramyl-(pentapeptide) pyrophosphoryl-undecaprenol N-acetylglucosamine transferase [Thermotoga profunda]